MTNPRQLQLPVIVTINELSTEDCSIRYVFPHNSCELKEIKIYRERWIEYVVIMPQDWVTLKSNNLYSDREEESLGDREIYRKVFESGNRLDA